MSEISDDFLRSKCIALSYLGLKTVCYKINSVCIDQIQNNRTI